MLTLEFAFPGGRYHATPGGYHVNEGLVEWPPSPWRILRAMVAVGFARYGWSRVPPDARLLLEELSRVLPRYCLPSAATAHSRHYMPLGRLDKGAEKTTLVYDTFADVGLGSIRVQWEVDLPEDSRSLVGELVSGLDYLGRSESWVEGKVIEAGQFLEANAWPCRSEEPFPGPAFEQVLVTASEPAGHFEVWCEEERVRIEETHTRVKGRAKKAIQMRQEALDRVPAGLVDALQWDTTRWRKAGWGQPPGSRRVLYWRRRDALEVGPPVKPRRLHGERVDCVLLALASKSRNRSALPTVARTLPQAEHMHRQLVSLVGRGQRVDCPELTGRDSTGNVLSGHPHVRVLPLDLDGDQHLDHVLLWAREGLGGAAQKAARSLFRTPQKGADDLHVSMVGAGELASLRGLPEELRGGVERMLGPREGANRWITRTLYVPPRHLKARGRSGLAGQIAEELRSLGFPEPSEVLQLSWRDARADLRLRHSILRRREGRPQPPNATGLLVRLQFDRLVRGPICIGYGSHFGLGQFIADV